jgi:hypothetical protein
MLVEAARKRIALKKEQMRKIAEMVRASAC